MRQIGPKGDARGTPECSLPDLFRSAPSLIQIVQGLLQAMLPVELKEGRLVSVGECMVELARKPDGSFGMAYGGDTFNTAVYLARAGVSTAYATALGDDPYSLEIRRLAETEGLAADLIVELAGRMPGLYLIETREGERSFWYWRDRAAARELFESSEAPRIVQGLEDAAVIYFSGVTLSLYSDRGLDLFCRSLESARTRGAIIAMDSNYRPRGWAGRTDKARHVFERFWRLSHIALPTFDDEQMLWGDATPAATFERLKMLNVPEIVVKLGSDGASIGDGYGRIEQVRVGKAVVPVDTTAAGDAFNAAYLAARVGGAPPGAAAALGHELAGVVVQHPGAIIPREATQTVLSRPPFVA